MTITAQKKFLRGFTLIELLIVIAIMGILAAAILVAINPLKRQQQARDAQRKSDIGQLASAVQAFSTSPGNGTYPIAFTALTASGDLKRIPTGPTAEAYAYTTSGGPTEVGIFVSLEAPTAATGFWCWRSSTGVATEITNSTACAAP